MTPRQIVKDVMEYIREKTGSLDEQEYDDILEQLSFEIEEERRLLEWFPDIEE